jgi:hypothetical protein
MDVSLPSTGQHWMEMYFAMQLYSAAIQSLPIPTTNPTTKGGLIYKSFYNFFSIIGADFKSFVSTKGAVSSATVTTTTQTGSVQSPTTVTDSISSSTITK